MSLKVPIHIIPAHTGEAQYRNEYTDSLQNMLAEAIRVDPNFCTYNRWDSTDYTGPFSELKAGFLAYIT